MPKKHYGVRGALFYGKVGVMLLLGCTEGGGGVQHAKCMENREEPLCPVNLIANCYVGAKKKPLARSLLPHGRSIARAVARNPCMRFYCILSFILFNYKTIFSLYCYIVITQLFYCCIHICQKITILQYYYFVILPTLLYHYIIV